MTELREQVDNTHQILEDDIVLSFGQVFMTQNDTEYDDIISSFDNDSMKEIAEFLQKNTVQIVTTKFKERVLKDFECCIRDRIQQHEHEVLLSLVMEEMHEHCVDCAQQLFDRLERLTKYLDYSTDATNGSIYEESSRVTTILAFSTDATRDFVRNAFVEVLVNWAYTSILMKTQVQEAIYKGFDDVMRDEIHQNASTVSVETSVDMFDSIAKHVVKELTTILQTQFDVYSRDHGIQQSLEKSVKAMAEKIMNYAAPTATTATPPAVSNPPVVAILPPPIPQATTTTSPSPSSTTLHPSISLLPQPLHGLPVVPTALPTLGQPLPTLGRPLPESSRLSTPRAASPIKDQAKVLPPPPPPLRSSFGVPPSPKTGQAPKTTSATSTISVLPPPPPRSLPSSRSLQPPKPSQRVSILE